ncbi:MAG: F0F1 ATP synthase subunit B [Planctomycetota bacterium]|nr:F0F1 ATP synthase subunit B [Planctomycetota bacterium]
MFIPEVQVLVWTVVVFFVLLGLLWKFAWGPILHALEEREGRISKKISDAETALKAANEKAAEYEKKIAAAKEEAAAIIAEGKRDVEKVRDEIMAAANAESARTLERAKREIALAKDAALQELRDRVVDLTAELAAQVIEREVKPEDHRRLIEESIQRVGASN